MLDELIREYGSKVYSLCLKLYDGNRSNSDDLYQDTWLRVYRSLDKYDQNRNFLPWVSKICVNIYKDSYRRKKIVSFITTNTNDEQECLLESIPQIQEDTEYQDVRNAIETLPEKLKLCIVLFYFNGSSVEETSKILGIPSGTVKSRLNKAREMLEKELNNDEK